MEGLSPYIKEQILAGRAVLFLGAGASMPAIGLGGRTGLSGNALRDKLCDKFLGGEGKARPLNYVADRCISVAGMGEVQKMLSKVLTLRQVILPFQTFVGAVSSRRTTTG